MSEGAPRAITDDELAYLKAARSTIDKAEANLLGAQAALQHYTTFLQDKYTLANGDMVDMETGTITTMLLARAEPS